MEPQIRKTYYGLIQSTGHECFRNESFIHELRGHKVQSPVDFNFFAGSIIAPYLDHVASEISINLLETETNLYNDRHRKVYAYLAWNTDWVVFSGTTPEDDNTGFDYVVISLGAIVSLLCLFHACLSHPSNLPSIGNPDSESAVRLSNFFLTDDYVCGMVLPIFPICPIRLRYADWLFTVCLDILFLHEITHLRSGHCEIAAILNSPKLYESRPDFSDPLRRAEIFQGCEIDADSGAIKLALRKAKFASNNIQGIVGDQGEAAKLATIEALGSTKNILKLMSFAAYAHLRQWANSTWTPEMQRGQTHPLRPLRMFLMCLHLAAEICDKQDLSYSFKEAVEDFGATALEAEKCLAILWQVPIDLDSIKSVTSKSTEVEAYGQVIEDAWKLTKPYVQKYKRGGICPD